MFSAQSPFTASNRSVEGAEIKPRHLIRNLHRKNPNTPSRRIRNDFATQLFRIIDGLTIPIDFILKSLIPLDSSLAVKIDQLSKHSSHKTNLMTYLLENLLSQLPFLLQLAKAKNLIT